ncbi:MAG: hypothetical protein ACXWK8_09445 [Myxococcaceae bacterium]
MATHIANIGPRALRKRLLMGVLFLVVSAVICAGLVVSHVHPAWRLGLVLPLFVAALGLFQALGKT